MIRKSDQWSDGPVTLSPIIPPSTKIRPQKGPNGVSLLQASPVNTSVQEIMFRQCTGGGALSHTLEAFRRCEDPSKECHAPSIKFERITSTPYFLMIEQDFMGYGKAHRRDWPVALDLTYSQFTPDGRWKLVGVVNTLNEHFNAICSLGGGVSIPCDPLTQGTGSALPLRDSLQTQAFHTSSTRTSAAYYRFDGSREEWFNYVQEGRARWLKQMRLNQEFFAVEDARAAFLRAGGAKLQRRVRYRLEDEWKLQEVVKETIDVVHCDVKPKNEFLEDVGPPLFHRKLSITR